MESTVKTPPAPTFLEFMPVSLFGAVMGLTALCFAWRQAHQIWQTPTAIPETIGFTAILTFITLTIIYTIKWIRYPALVAREFKNSISIGFFGTITISIMLIPGVILPYNAKAAGAIWLFGVILTLLLAWFVLRKWTDEQQQKENAVPAWVLPVTGTLNVPIVGNSLKFAGAHECCVAFFGIGIIFIIILMAIIFNRLFFEAPLPPPLQPSLFILVAPLALAFNGYEGLTSGPDLPAACFFYFTLFLGLLFGSKLLLLPKCCPFQVSWWSVSFPLGSLTLACIRYAQNQPDTPHWLLAAGMLIGTTLVILYLLIQTITQIWKMTRSPKH
jgi:tellurite resistance protein